MASATTSTTVLEMHSQPTHNDQRSFQYPSHFRLSQDKNNDSDLHVATPSSAASRDQKSDFDHRDEEDTLTSTPPTPVVTNGAAAVQALERWNQPRGNVFRLAAAFLSFFLCGLNDASFGALLPYLERYYDLSYVTVSLVFLFPFVGYTIAAFINATVHAKLGQRGIAVITPVCHILYYIVLSLHAPWPVVIVFSCVGGFGIGLIDGAWSAWTGHMVSGNALEGLLHSFYALGCTFSPLVATSLVTVYEKPWYTFYYIMLGISVLELATSTASFWSKTGLVYRLAHPNTSATEGRTKQALKNRVTWLCSAFFLLYVGAEVALGGWIVTFMLNIRGASPYASGVSATGFWAGMTLGRAGLGFFTEMLSSRTQRYQERFCVTVYLFMALALQLVFWLVPSFTVSAVAVAFLGVFLGPIFPSGIIMATKLLPSEIHISSVGFSTALGGTGGAVFPFAVGAIAQAKGVQVLQPIILSLLVVLTVIWFLFPRVKKRRED